MSLAEVKVSESQRLQIKERHLEAEGFEGCVCDFCPLCFDIASIETSVADKVYSFGGDVWHQERDELQRRNVDLATQAGGGLAIPKLHPLAIVSSSTRTSYECGLTL